MSAKFIIQTIFRHYLLKTNIFQGFKQMKMSNVREGYILTHTKRGGISHEL